MQINSRLLDDIARVANGALGVAAGVRGEVEALLRQRFERILTDMDLVSREEFEAVKAMAAKARAEQEALAKKVTRLEAALKAVKGGSGRRLPQNHPARDPPRARPRREKPRPGPARAREPRLKGAGFSQTRTTAVAFRRTRLPGVRRRPWAHPLIRPARSARPIPSFGRRGGRGTKVIHRNLQIRRNLILRPLWHFGTLP